MIGPSGSGKTTAITLLAGRLGYLTDETVSARRRPCSCTPTPSRCRSSPTATRRTSSSPLSPDELGLLHPPEQAYLHRIVLLHRGEDDDGLVPLAPARAIAEIVTQCSSLAHLEHPIHRLADTIDACGGAWALHYVEFADWIDDLVHLLDVEAPAARPTAAPPRRRRRTRPARATPGPAPRGATRWSTTTSWC